MTAPDQYQWRRDKDGLGVWEHRGKVAVAGVGQSPVDRRWDGVSMDQTLGAYSILACQKAMDEAGVTPDQIDGVICCDSHIAGGSGGSASQWAPRPYFPPPYDSELGLTLVNAQWLIEQMALRNVKFAPTSVPTISEMVGMAAQAVGDGMCNTCLVIYPTGNLEGRYRRGGENADDYARGARQWTAPWGNHGGNDFINIFPHEQYCRKYGGRHDDLAPFVLNHAQHNFRKRSTQEDLDEIEDWTDRAARRMYEGAGLGPADVDIFNPYDGYSIMAQFFLEGFQWHGVKRGDSFAFYAGDIRVEGPHPLCSSGGNLGIGRCRTAMYTDSIEQLRGTAGPRQVAVRAETALAAFTTPSSGGWIMFGKEPS